MAHELKRHELHALVWSTPMRRLAERFGMSDRGLAKICAAENIPVPTRGYWAKLQAGQRVSACPLPSRGLGQHDWVSIGNIDRRHDRESEDDILDAEVPQVPVFAVDLETVRTQVATLVKKAPLPLRAGGDWHSQISKLLTADEERDRKQRASAYPSSWNGPIFRTPFEVRRLRILNAIFVCASRCGHRPHLSGKHGRELSITVGDILVPFSLDAAGAAEQIVRERHGYAFLARGENDRMRLSLSSHWSSDPTAPFWEDLKDDKLEEHLRDILVEMIVSAEQRVRNAAMYRREWLIDRKAEIREERRKRAIEEEQRRRAREARLQQARVDHLLTQANAFQQATQIRAFVARVRKANGRAPEPMTREELDDWAAWALAQAARVDPVASGAFRTKPTETAD